MTDELQAAQRPFYLIVCFWGERFRNYFLDFCLPSLLAPGNLPALVDRRLCKLLIACTPEDEAALQSHPVFHAATRFITPMFFHIPPGPAGVEGCAHMGVGHKLMSQQAFDDKAYAVMLTPDMIISDGTLAKCEARARAGYEVVLCAAARFAEETFFSSLRGGGAMKYTDHALALTGAQLARAAINGLHSETQAYEWDMPVLEMTVPIHWWRVPSEMGMLLHSMSWAPLLLDYGAIKNHDMRCLDKWTMDGNYVHANFGSAPEKIYIVRDSDEMFVASWAPAADRPHSLTPSHLYNQAHVGQMAKGAMLRMAYHSGVFDPLKQRIFFEPVRWHPFPIVNGAEAKWQEVEARAQRALRSYVAEPQPTWVASGDAPVAVIADDPALEFKASGHP